MVIGARLDAAGVHNVEDPVAPLARGVQPVPGDAGGVLHDGQPLAAQLVKQHGLAHIGPATIATRGFIWSLPLFENAFVGADIVRPLLQTWLFDCGRTLCAPTFLIIQ